MKKIGFVILTWNSSRYIKKCIDSILKFNDIDVEISICDNGSNDETKNILNEYGKRENVLVKYLEKNYGTTKSRNIAIKALSKCDYLCILDSDTEIKSEDEFLKLVEYLDNNPKCGIIGPTLVSLDGSLQYSGRNFPLLREKFYKVLPFKNLKEKAHLMEHVNYDEQPDYFSVGYLMSACWLMKWESFEKIGYLDEKIFYAPEDVEYCARCWKAGLKVVYCKEVSIIHEWQRISRKKLFSKHNFEHIKGLFYLNRKHKMKKIKID